MPLADDHEPAEYYFLLHRWLIRFKKFAFCELFVNGNPILKSGASFKFNYTCY